MDTYLNRHITRVRPKPILYAHRKTSDSSTCAVLRSTHPGLQLHNFYYINLTPDSTAMCPDHHIVLISRLLVQVSWIYAEKKSWKTLSRPLYASQILRYRSSNVLAYITFSLRILRIISTSLEILAPNIQFRTITVDYSLSRFTISISKRVRNLL